MNKKKIIKELEEFKGTHKIKNYENLSFDIILVHLETAGNAGSIARIMKNFDFTNLIIFNPLDSKEHILSYETQGFAMHGKNILLNSNIIDFKNQDNHLNALKSLLKQYDFVIGTTAKGKSYNNLKRLAIFPQHLTLPHSIRPLKIAILFGRESRGLTNDELELTDLLLRIPASKEYPTLNLAQACGIILYELFKKLHVITIGRGKSPVLLANRKDRQLFYKILKSLIKRFKIRNYRSQNAFLAFKNVIERSFISKKELSLIIGFFTKISHLTEDVDLFPHSKDTKRKNKGTKN